MVVSLEALDEEALVRILVEPKNALTKQYKKLFELEDVGLTFDPESLRAVAPKALKRGTGARGLRAILETMMTDIMFDLPNREDVREIVITKEAISEGTSPLIVTERATDQAGGVTTSGQRRAGRRRREESGRDGGRGAQRAPFGTSGPRRPTRWLSLPVEFVGSFPDPRSRLEPAAPRDRASSAGRTWASRA